jgi:hypothetical protein
MPDITIAAMERALGFLASPFVIAMAIALLTASIFKVCGSRKYCATIDFGLSASIALAFAAFGFTLGIFVGMTGNLLVTTVLGTVTTTGTALLALLYGKDSIASSYKVLVPALITFFLVTPLMIDYVLQYHALLLTAH